jgi:PAS domain-containing protein
VSRITRNQSALRLIPRGERDHQITVFCGHCGRSPEEVTGDTRVCPKCGLGLLLEAPVDVAPSPGDPFLVIDSNLAVCAVSRDAERLLGVAETDAVNRPITDFFSGGETERAPDVLRAALAATIGGDQAVRQLVLRPANTFGVRYWARIGSCGPPSAVLLVLADAR